MCQLVGQQDFYLEYIHTTWDHQSLLHLKKHSCHTYTCATRSTNYLAVAVKQCSTHLLHYNRHSKTYLNNLTDHSLAITDPAFQPKAALSATTKSTAQQGLQSGVIDHHNTT
jgi:hypothetical protein